MENDDRILMRATPEWIEKKYNEMNQLLFNGSLGQCNFGLFSSGRGSEGGWLGRFRIGGKIVVNRITRQMSTKPKSSGFIFVEGTTIRQYNFYNLCQPYIEFNSHYQATEDALLHVLVHEMCHYYTYMYGKAPKQGHGTEFKQIAQYIYNVSNGKFNITTHCDSAAFANFKLDDDMTKKKETRKENKKSKTTAILVFNDTNHIELSLIASTNQSLLNRIINVNTNKDKFREDKRGKTTAIWTSNDSDFINLLFNNGYSRVFRTYKYWNIENKPFVEELFNLPHEIVFKNDMKESKKTISQIINEELNSYIKKQTKGDYIEITPDMDLSEYSPLEIN